MGARSLADLVRMADAGHSAVKAAAELIVGSALCPVPTFVDASKCAIDILQLRLFHRPSYGVYRTLAFKRKLSLCAWYGPLDYQNMGDWLKLIDPPAFIGANAVDLDRRRR